MKALETKFLEFLKLKVENNGQILLMGIRMFLYEDLFLYDCNTVDYEMSETLESRNIAGGR